MDGADSWKGYEVSSANLIMAALGEKMFTHSTYTTVYSGSGVITPPVGAKAMRVAAIGAGGRIASGSFSYPGGGGGGCAASKIVPASPITYSVGAGGNATIFEGGNTTAQFTGYNLVGGGGKSVAVNNGVSPGGVGTGGDYNFSGGAGNVVIATRSGGSAGPNGNGGDGGQDGQYAGTGWGPGGGAGSAPNDMGTTNVQYRSSGGGAPGSSSIHMYSKFSSGPFSAPIDTSGGAGNGGIPGGGGGVNGVGGSGCVLVEWFY